MILSDFLEGYLQCTTLVEVVKDGETSTHQFFVTEYFCNKEEYKEIADKNIKMIGIEDNRMVIYL